MPSWDKAKFDNVAQGIVKDAAATSQNLFDLTAKQAKEAGLNDEQICRLSRAVNVKMFENKYASTTGKADRYVEFEPIDPDKVTAAVHQKVAARYVKQAAASYPELTEEMRPRRPELALLEKQASAPLEPKETKEALYFRLKKAAEELGVQKTAAEVLWSDSMQTLLAGTKLRGWDHAVFEKSALALYGEHVLPEINAIREQAKLEGLVSEKTASELHDDGFGAENWATEAVKRASDARVKFLRYGEAAKSAQARINALHQEIARGGK